MRCARPTVWPTAVYSIPRSSPIPPTTTSPELRPIRTRKFSPLVRRSSAANSPSSSIRWSAAKQARWAWSSWAIGAPNRAMMPSPVNLSTVPSNWWTPSQRIAKKRSMICRHSSGSLPSASSIEPITSANSTVTCLRSPSIATAAARIFSAR